jgi:hypothetical protein
MHFDMRITVHNQDVLAWEGTDEHNLPNDWRDLIGREGRVDHEWGVRSFMEAMEGTPPPRQSFIRKELSSGIVASIYRYTHWCGCWIERTRDGEIWDQEPCCSLDVVGDVTYATPLIRSLCD